MNININRKFAREGVLSCVLYGNAANVLLQQSQYGTPALVCRRRFSCRALNNGLERLFLAMLAERCRGQPHLHTRIHGVPRIGHDQARPSLPLLG